MERDEAVQSEGNGVRSARWRAGGIEKDGGEEEESEECRVEGRGRREEGGGW